MRPQPPKWINRLLLWYCNPIYANEIAGDLEELFELWVQESGPRKARWRYAWNALLFIRMYNSRFGQNVKSMNLLTQLTHGLKISWRNLFRYRVFHVSNILGLAFGLGVSLLILIHVHHELRYEKHIPDHDHLYRISTHQEWAKSSVMLGEKLTEYFPDVTAVGRFSTYAPGTAILSADLKQTTAENVFQADSTVIDMFGFELLEGDRVNPLSRPNTVILSWRVSSRLFGSKSPIGRKIRINDRGSFEVTAVYRDLPETSHLQADVFLSMDTFYENLPTDLVINPGWMVMYTYVKTRPDVTLQSLVSRMPDFQRYYVPEEYWDEIGDTVFEVMPLADIHLNSDRIQEMGENSDLTYVIILSSLGIFVLIIAAVNFVNIFTAIGLRRTREVGVRKLVGAQRPMIVFQLLIESMLSGFLAAVLALLIAGLLIPWYNQAIGQSLTHWDLFQPLFLGALTGVALMIGMCSGLYPALMIASQDPMQSVARNEQPKATITYFRKGLIVLQFGISLFVCIGGVVISQQMTFIDQQGLGYDRDHLINIRTYGDLREKLGQNSTAVKHEMRAIAGVHEVGRISHLVGEPLSIESFVITDREEPLESGVNMLWGDETFLSVMGISLVSGEHFHAMDSGVAFIINETLFDQIGPDAIGRMASWRGERGPIVGVMEDYHHYSLKSLVEPTVLTYRPEWAGQWLVRLDQQQSSDTFTELESLVKDTTPGAYFLSGFIDQRVKQLYRADQNMLQMVQILTFLALLISSVGLLGMASVEIQRRTKEISIRQVLGASPMKVLRMLMSQFVLMIAFALCVAVPASIWFGKSWLANFTLQIDLHPMLFIVPILLIFLIIAGIVVSQAYPVMRRNPGNVLRKE